MKSLEQIKECRRLIIDEIGIDGGRGHIHIGTWDGSVIWSFDGGWDHVSVRPFAARIIPTWDDMCLLKRIFFDDTETVIQIHPAESEYVNNVSNCLHLWKCQGEMPLPPSWMVGTKKGEDMIEVYRRAEKELYGK